MYRWFLFYQPAAVLHLFHTLSGLALAVFNFGEAEQCFGGCLAPSEATGGTKDGRRRAKSMHM